MKKEIIDFWLHQATLQEKTEIDALRKVLDPADLKGVKNSYIDVYLKYYLREYLRPEKTDSVLEVGCGIGRLTEYLSRFVHSAYGIDIADKFIDGCRANPHKNENTRYLKLDELAKLKALPINKMYIVWVLMYLTDRGEIVETLTRYRNVLPELKKAVVLEQVKSSSQTEYRNGRINCYYHTIEEYTEMFHAAGFKVSGYVLMGERHYGVLYRLIHIMCNLLPRKLACMAGKMFLFDKKILGNTRDRVKLINNRKPTDIIFLLETA